MGLYPTKEQHSMEEQHPTTEQHPNNIPDQPQGKEVLPGTGKRAGPSEKSRGTEVSEKGKTRKEAVDFDFRISGSACTRAGTCPVAGGISGTSKASQELSLLSESPLFPPYGFFHQHVVPNAGKEKSGADERN